MKTLFFLSHEFFVYSFFYEYRKNNNVLCINNNEYIFVLIITCINFLLDYDQLFLVLFTKKVY